MSWEKFFFYLNRLNAVLILAVILTLGWVLLAELFRTHDDVIWHGSSPNSGFGADFNRTNSIIGQAEDTSDGEIVAYYEEDEDSSERRENAGLVLAHPKSGRTLAIAKARKDLLVDFNFLYDQGKPGGPVVGYIAKIASEADFREGKFDLVIGAIPEMTRNVVGEDLRFADLPQVRSDGTLGLIFWQTEDEAEMVGIRLEDGAVLDRASIDLPIIAEDRVSQGPGIADDSALKRQRADPWETAL